MLLFTATAFSKADISHFRRAKTYFYFGLFSFLKALHSSVAYYSNLEAMLGKDGATWFLDKNHPMDLEEISP